MEQGVGGPERTPWSSPPPQQLPLLLCFSCGEAGALWRGGEGVRGHCRCEQHPAQFSITFLPALQAPAPPLPLGALVGEPQR